MKEEFRRLKIWCRSLEELTCSAELVLDVRELDEIYELAISISDLAYSCRKDIEKHNQD